MTTPGAKSAGVFLPRADKAKANDMALMLAPPICIFVKMTHIALAGSRFLLAKTKFAQHCPAVYSHSTRLYKLSNNSCLLH